MSISSHDGVMGNRMELVFFTPLRLRVGALLMTLLMALS
jgi:hypothetical protein